MANTEWSRDIIRIGGADELLGIADAEDATGGEDLTGIDFLIILIIKHISDRK